MSAQGNRNSTVAETANMYTCKPHGLRHCLCETSTEVDSNVDSWRSLGSSGSCPPVDDD